MATNPQVTAEEAPDDQSTALPEVETVREEADSWRVEWADGSSRETPLAGMAWYAREFDAEATVNPLTDE